MTRKITLGKLKNSYTGRQIKILGKTHLKKLKSEYEGETLIKEIKKYEGLQGLISGNMKKLKQVTQDKLILSDNEITKLFSDISQREGRHGFKFKMSDGSIRFISASLNGKIALRELLKQNYNDVENGDVIILFKEFS